jgi:hypothetical protein
MRFKTKVLIPAIALLASLLVSLPVAQNQANANERHNRCVVSTASRSYQRLPYAKPAYNKRFAQTYMANKYGWCGNQFPCLVTLWNRESGWRVNAHNRSSGAHGIPQSLPGNKMASAGPDWYNNPQTQIKWGLKYIKARYGTPCSALSSWNHKGWY